MGKVLTVIFILFSGFAHSSLYVEPSLAIAPIAKLKDTNSTGTYKYSSNYIEMGTRVGFLHDRYILGLDLNHSLLNYVYKPEQVTDANSFEKYLDRKHYNVGFFFSYSLPKHLLLRASYFMKSELKTVLDRSGRTATDVGDKYKGYGYEVSFTYQELPKVFLSLIYRYNSYKEFEDGGTGVISAFPSETQYDYRTRAILLSVGYPMKFLD
ncbi:MAG: hypothetical protein GY909_10870 [Oligoflexia bacterium]|nr:hypothetical protein [Oligoflexia bacterium]